MITRQNCKWQLKGKFFFLNCNKFDLNAKKEFYILKFKIFLIIYFLKIFFIYIYKINILIFIHKLKFFYYKKKINSDNKKENKLILWREN